MTAHRDRVPSGCLTPHIAAAAVAAAAAAAAVAAAPPAALSRLVGLLLLPLLGHFQNFEGLRPCPCVSTPGVCTCALANTWTRAAVHAAAGQHATCGFASSGKM